MKKLMIGCAIALSAVAANAVSFKWSAAELKYGGEYVGGETTMYVYKLGGDTAASGGAAYTALMALYNEWDQKSGTSLSEFLYDTYKDDFAEWTNEKFTSGASLITEDVDKNKWYSGVVLITHTDASGNIDAVMGNAFQTGKVGSGGGSVTDLATEVGGNWGFGEFEGSTGWYTVPEPTSGLLLLLGVAGLALRRRRA